MPGTPRDITPIPHILESVHDLLRTSVSGARAITTPEGFVAQNLVEDMI